MASVTIEEGRSPRKTYLSLDRLMKETLAEISGVWHEKFLPLHFKEGNQRRYEMAPRDLFYNRSKEKRYGHKRPLVKSGAAMRQISTSMKVATRNQKARGMTQTTVRMSAPRYLYYTQRTKNWKYVWSEKRGGFKWRRDGYVGNKVLQPHKEITKLLPQEREVLVREYSRRMRARLNEVSPKSRRRFEG